LETILAILRAGGFVWGGLNFDAKIWCNSVDLSDLFESHIGGMDAFAIGLVAAQRIIEDGKLAAFVKERYASFTKARGPLQAGPTIARSLGRPRGSLWPRRSHLGKAGAARKPSKQVLAELGLGSGPGARGVPPSGRSKPRRRVFSSSVFRRCMGEAASVGIDQARIEGYLAYFLEDGGVADSFPRRSAPRERAVLYDEDHCHFGGIEPQILASSSPQTAFSVR